MCSYKQKKIDEERKTKIALVYLSLIHYRKSVFETLLKNKDIEFYIIAGKKNPIPNLKNFQSDSNNVIYIRNFNIKIRKNVFTYQFGSLMNLLKLKPDLVILLGVNPLIVSSLFTFIILKLFTKIKVLWWGHGTLGHQGRFGTRFRLFFYKKSDGVILYTKENIDPLKKLGIKNPFYVVDNAMNMEDYGFLLNNNFVAAKIESKIKRPESFNILYSGRLIKKKKVEIIFEALKRIRANSPKSKFKLIIVGDGYYKQKLVEISKNDNINELVEFKGALYEKDLYETFLACDVCIIPGYVGLSIIHANSYGLPIITNDLMGAHPPEINYIKDGINGSFYEEDNVESLVQEIYFWKEKLEKNYEKTLCDIIDKVKKLTPAEMVNKFKNIFTKYANEAISKKT